MRTKKGKRGGAEAEVPLSSMIDVVFLLLIYFIVTQKPILTNTFLQVDMPTRRGSAIEMTAPLVVDVRKADGEDYSLMGNRIGKEQLFEYLGALAKNDPEQLVIVNCGPNAKHQKLISLLDGCAAIGLTKLSVVNDAGIKFEEK